SSSAYLFAPRPAYRSWRWWTDGYGTSAGECCAPSDRFAGENPSPGTLVSYWLSTASRHDVRFEVLDSSGHVVASWWGASAAGLGRVSWDLAENAPTPWFSAADWNQGPDEGALVVPGTYLLRMHAGPVVTDQPLVVRRDPRAAYSQADYAARHDFQRSLLSELDSIDVALNALDAQAKRHALSVRERSVY